MSESLVDGKRITLRDVATAAGVTTSTVSKVINDRRDVGPEVRQRVQDTIAALGYRPNSVARGLRTQRSDTIAIVTDDLEGIFTNSLMRGVEEVASAADKAVLLCNSYGDREREARQLSRLIDRQIDALIFMSGNRVGPRPEPAMEVPDHIPYVYLYEYGPPGTTAVLPDDQGGAALAVDHLIERGARRIVFLNGPTDWEATADRLAGFTAALERNGLPATSDLVESSPTWDPEDGYATMNALFERVPDLDAVFCCSDDLATGALEALHDRGVAVPNDVQVVGFDNRSLAIHQRPPLTTVALPLVEMGMEAGRLVLGERPIPESLELRVGCSLVARESTRS